MTLSKEKLAHYAMHTDGSVKAMARELIERRGRDKQEPDGWQFLGVNGLWVNVTENGMRQALKEGSEVRALYAAPQLPQPAVPEYLENLRSLVADKRALPRRKEWVSGQQYSYVLLENVEGLVEEACRAAMLQGAEPVSQHPQLTVWYGSMPETNGKANWTAILHRKGECLSTGITIDRSEYPERVRYEADRMRHVIGELKEKPDILAYDADAHSGYIKPVSQPYTLRDGWVAVPVDMTAEMMRAVQINSELGAYAAANLTGAYSLFREFWDVAIAAAPQQEAE